jgi:hypothetical protein
MREKAVILTLAELLKQYKRVDYEEFCPICHPAKAKKRTHFEQATAIMLHHRKLARIIVSEWLRFYLPSVADAVMKPVAIDQERKL